MDKQYYYLITSLPLLRLDDYKGPYRVTDFVNELNEHLIPRHCEYAQDILYAYDNAYIIDAVLKRDVPLARHTASMSFEQIKEKIKNKDYEADEYLVSFLEEFSQINREGEGFSRKQAERLILTRYFERRVNHPNRFIRNYFQFELDLRNILVALNKRRFDLKQVDFIEAGDQAIINRLKNSTASDFGLSADIDYIVELVETFNKNDIMHCEKYIDILRWQRIDEINKLNYFEVDVLLGYLVKLMLVERWIALDAQKGRGVFERRTTVENSLFFK